MDIIIGQLGKDGRIQNSVRSENTEERTVTYHVRAGDVDLTRTFPLSAETDRPEWIVEMILAGVDEILSSPIV